MEEKADKDKINLNTREAKGMFFQEYIYQSHTISPTAQTKKYNRMHVEEIAERGKILRDLHFSSEDAQRRIETEIAWEYELSQLPPFYKQINEIIDRLYTG